jgi:hypothetical protein
MEREGYKRSTIKSAIKTLLATATYTQNRKHKIITDVSGLYRQLGIKWERPRSGPNGGNHTQPNHWLEFFVTVKFMSYVIADDLQWFT